MSGSTLFVRDLMLLCPLLVASARVMTVGVVSDVGAMFFCQVNGHD